MRRIVLDNKFIKILLIELLLLFSLPAYAQKTEWIDPSYNFTKARRIFVGYTVAPELCNGITEKESSNWFFSQIKKELVDKIPSGYKVESQYKAEERILKETGISMESRITESPEEAKVFFAKFLRDNYDLLLEAALLENMTGQKYRSGYTYTTTVPQTSTVLGPGGQLSTVTTTAQQVHSVPGGNVPTTTIVLRFDVTDTATAKYVWSLLDRREKSDEMLEKVVNPKGMFNRITADFSSCFIKVLQEETGKKKKKDVGF